MQNDLKRVFIPHSKSPRFRLQNSSHLVDPRSEVISEVFPNNLPGIPPEWEIDFCMDFLPNTNPISFPLYRMASTELKELNAQFKDLLDRGFIRPSISLWGASILFVKNKDGSLRMCID